MAGNHPATHAVRRLARGESCRRARFDFCYIDEEGPVKSQRSRCNSSVLELSQKTRGISRSVLQLTFESEVWIEADQYVARANPLNVLSCGSSKEDAGKTHARVPH